MKILFGLAFLLCISVGYALKCNTCLSLKSWDDCKNNTIQFTCLDSQDRCGKADIKAENPVAAVEVFAKACATSSECSARYCKSIYPSVKITKCEIDCCEGDLCNGAKVPMVSAIMLLACAIATFAR
ncbi:unnamed protein product [Porites evermanni]|uniref:UPAR/Ly6 domain-containing protein n=1 Tax=Porites evermanni TaxID=104178 RepID=A0ABN8M4L8_9CNID|nr:unnamed protein product [Porites evermanni]